METKPLNQQPYNNVPGANKSEKKKSGAAGIAAATAAGMAAGAAGTYMASASEIELEPEITENPEEPENTETTTTPGTSHPGNSHPGNNHPGNNHPQQPQQPQPQPVQQPAEPAEPMPITIGDDSNDNAINVDPNPMEGLDDDDPFNPIDPVNPDDVADAIIAEDLIDPNDIDPENYFDFTDIGTVTTIEGDEMTVATFTTGNDEVYAMVDVNNDGIMDVVVDENGNEVSYNTGGYTTDDIMDQLTAGDTYLAASDDYDPTLDAQMNNDMIS